MSLDKISAQLGKQEKGLPPVESWNPPYCGEIDIEIKANGDWYYAGTIFKRLPLVKLFASVLIREVSEQHDDYFLVTPVEKVKIKVEQTPFMLTEWSWCDNQEAMQKNMLVQTNLGDEFILNDEHPLIVSPQGDLLVIVRRNLLAKVHRNVYYQWIELAQEVKTAKGTELVITSADCQFSLGLID